jgi:hypothetical protein
VKLWWSRNGLVSAPTGLAVNTLSDPVARLAASVKTIC